MLWLPLCCPCSPCARVQWQTGRFRLRCSRELRSRVVVAAVAFEPVAAPVRQAHVVPCEWITAARHWDDLVDLGTQRVWCAQCFVDWLPADRAHIICGEHPLAQLFPAPAVAVSGIGAHDGSPWLVVYAQRLIYPTPLSASGLCSWFRPCAPVTPVRGRPYTWAGSTADAWAGAVDTRAGTTKIQEHPAGYAVLGGYLRPLIRDAQYYTW